MYLNVDVQLPDLNLIFGCFAGFGLILMLRTAVVKIMTFVKGVTLE